MNFVCVLHQDVTDWAGFDELGAELAHAPEGSVALAYFPAKDHRSAICVWRTHDLPALRAWLDARTAALSRNTYVEIDEKQAMGLPRMAAHA